MKHLKYLLLLTIALGINGCSVYNFTGTGKIDAKTFQVNYFQNNAPLIEPGIERTFTQRLQNLIQNQTNLNLVSTGGDLIYEGEIVDYRISPTTATADQRAAESNFSGTEQLVGSRLTTALDEIFERITQDIFNESLAKW